MRLAQHRFRQPTQVAHPCIVFQVGRHWQREGSKERHVQIHEHLQKGDCQDDQG